MFWQKARKFSLASFLGNPFLRLLESGALDLFALDIAQYPYPTHTTMKNVKSTTIFFCYITLGYPSLYRMSLETLEMQNYKKTRNPASRASKRERLVAMYIEVVVCRVTSEVAVSFLPEVVAQI